MGFVSKTIFLTTGVPGITSSTKQKQLKAQRAQLAELRKQTAIMQQLADPEASARAAAAEQARHEQRLAQVTQRREAQALAAQRRQELRAARGPITLPHWLRVTLRSLAWALAGLFGFAAFGAVLEANVAGAVTCTVIAVGTAVLLRRSRTVAPIVTK